MFQIKWMWQNLKGKRNLLIIGLILSAVSTSLVVVNPLITKSLIDNVLVLHKLNLLNGLLIAMVAFTLVRSGMRYIMVQCLERSSQHMLESIRNKVYRNLTEQDMRFYTRIRTGDLMTRVTGDMDVIRQVVAYDTYCAIDSVSILIASAIVLVKISVTLTLILFALTPLLAVISAVFMKNIRKRWQEKRQKLSELNTRVQENIAGNRVVKAFAREDYEKQRFDDANENFRKTSTAAEIAWQKFWPIVEFLAQSLNIVTILVGGIFVINKQITIGDLIVFIGLTWAVAQPMRTLGQILNDLQRFLASSEKVIEIYYSKSTIADRHDAIDESHVSEINGAIQFQNVTFTYDGHEGSPILNDVSFNIEAGQTIGIMGPTGSGKTTIVNLLDRFFDVQEGCIKIDGIDIKLMALSTLRKAISIATQDVFLFSDTVDGAISYGDPDMPEEQMKHYAKAAGASEFVEKMPEGYDTVVGERGVGLSGGQRQRIALARALAIRPKVLILDDTTSAVDMETEMYIQKQLRELDYPCTKIIIAQRISSVQKADKIFIVGDGKVEQGTHETLIARPGYYREVCEIQDVAGIPSL